MNRYKLVLRHDAGILNLTLWADTRAKAIDVAMLIERCPRCAIQSCRKRPPAPFGEK